MQGIWKAPGSASGALHPGEPHAQRRLGRDGGHLGRRPRSLCPTWLASLAIGSASHALCRKPPGDDQDPRRCSISCGSGSTPGQRGSVSADAGGGRCLQPTRWQPSRRGRTDLADLLDLPWSGATAPRRAGPLHDHPPPCRRLDVETLFERDLRHQQEDRYGGPTGALPSLRTTRPRPVSLELPAQLRVVANAGRPLSPAGSRCVAAWQGRPWAASGAAPRCGPAPRCRRDRPRRTA